MKWMIRFSKKQIVAFTWLFVTVSLVRSPVIRAQDERKEELRLSSFSPIDIYPFVGDSWVTWEITLENRSRVGRDARVLVSYADQPHVQYGRDVWVPARSSLSTWILIGPAPKKASEESGSVGQLLLGPISGSSRANELRILLYDRTGG